MKSIHTAANFEKFQALSASEMAAVEGGNRIVRAISAAITAGVGLVADILVANPYCVPYMIAGKPCL